MLIVSVFPFCASTMYPFIQRVTMFIGVIWIKICTYFWCVSCSFNSQHHCEIFINLSSISLFGMCFFSLLGSSFTHDVFSFSLFMRVCTWVSYRALFSRPVFVFFCFLHTFHLWGVLVLAFSNIFSVRDPMCEL